MRYGWGSYVLMALGMSLVGGPLIAADSSTRSEELLVLDSANNSAQTFPVPANAPENRYHLALGVSYTGGQIRYQFSPKWAVEGHYQFGSADSNWGSIHSNVFGGRGYRFFYLRQRLAWYLGGDGNYVTASSHSYNYQTTGFAAGTFAGLEYRILPRLAIGADIGPYVISLNEKLSGLSETGIDFVVNTAINFYLF
jgi:hypothetical protein